MVDKNTCDVRGKRLRDVRIVPDSLRYPDRSDYSEGPSVEDKGDGKWRFTVKVDRNGSEAVAKDFGVACQNSDYHCFNYFNINGNAASLPLKLNFFFAAELDFEDCSTALLYFGQGHTSSTQQNNWWIGGPNVLSVYNGFLILRGSDDMPVYQRIRPDISDFKFENP